MRKVLLHNLTHQYSSYSPDLFYFDENAVFFAESGDYVVSRKKIDGEYITFLEKIGCIQKNINFFSSNNTISSSPESIFKYDDIVSSIQKKMLLSKEKKWVLDSFVLTNLELEWAHKIGLEYDGDSDHYFWGNKSNFRSLALKNNIPIPEGFEHKEEGLDVVLSIIKLFLKGFPEVVIKEDEGVAGLGSIRLTKNTFLSRWKELLLHIQDTNRGVIPIESNAFVIERWYPNVRFSPSIQLYIDPQGLVKVLSLHNQLFYNNKMTYRGCASEQWLPELAKETLTVTGVKFAKILSKKGYRGHLSFNTIVTDGGALLFTEVNLRRVMSSYPFQIMQRLRHENRTPLLYISFRIQKNAWKGKRIEDILKQLSPNLFTRKDRRGIIPYNYGLLCSKGQLYILCIGTSKKEVSNFLSYAISL